MIQIDMEMPTYCGECRFYNDNFDYCYVLESEIRTDQFMTKGICPLEEVDEDDG